MWMAYSVPHKFGVFLSRTRRKRAGSPPAPRFTMAMLPPSQHVPVANPCVCDKKDLTAPAGLAPMATRDWWTEEHTTCLAGARTALTRRQ